MRGCVKPVDDPEIADPLARSVGERPPPALGQLIGRTGRPVDPETRAGLGDLGRGPDPW